MSNRAAEKDLGLPKWLCLACGSPLTGHELRLRLDDDEQLRQQCHICFEEQQVVSFEQLATESERFKELIDQIELRYDYEVARDE